MIKNSQLVYSTLPHLNQKCSQCQHLKTECTCESESPIELKNIVAKLRIEKSGRNGKTVTVIDNLPKSESFLKEWCTDLKKKCGTGGTYLVSDLSGIIEIQGDKRDMVRNIFLKKEIKVKG